MGRTSAERWLANTSVANLQFLDVSGGQGTPGDLARTTAQIISVLRSTVDVIIIDTPPLSVTAESLEFAPLATVSLLLARLDRSTVSAAGRAQELLRFGGASLVVLAITDAGQPSRRRYRYYGYYSGSADESAKGRKSGKRAGKRTGGPLVPGAEPNRRRRGWRACRRPKSRAARRLDASQDEIPSRRRHVAAAARLPAPRRPDCQGLHPARRLKREARMSTVLGASAGGRRVVASLGLVAIAAYCGVLAWCMEHVSYDTWAALVIAPFILAVSLPMIRWITRDDDDPMFGLLGAALVVKLLASLLRYFVAFELYGGRADAARYDLVGRAARQSVHCGLASITRPHPARHRHRVPGAPHGDRVRGGRSDSPGRLPSLLLDVVVGPPSLPPSRPRRRSRVGSPPLRVAAVLPAVAVVLAVRHWQGSVDAAVHRCRRLRRCSHPRPPTARVRDRGDRPHGRGCCSSPCCRRVHGCSPRRRGLSAGTR